MADLQVMVDTRTVEVETYYWKCPGCGCNMSACRHPGDARENQLCRECYRGWERQRFDGHFSQVMGATVTAVIQPEEAFDWQDVKRLELVDAQGRRWLVTSDDVLYVYLDERTPGVQGGGDGQ